MNICFISSHELDPTYGGTERVSYNLSQEMIRRGHNVTCCFMFNVPNEEFKSSVDSIKLPFGASSKLREDSSALAQFLSDNKVDVMMFQSHHSYFWDVCVEAKMKTGVKLIYNLHSDPRSGIKEVNDRFARISLSENGVRKYYKLLYNYIKLPYTYYSRYSHSKAEYSKFYRECDKFVLLSQSFIPSLCRLISIDSKGDKLCAITNPMLPKDSMVSDKKKQVAFVGRATIPHKRPDRVLDMWSALHKQYPEWNLVIIGDGPDLQHLKDYANRKRLERVTFTGQTNPMPYFSESTISCVTSTHEGFGMVIIEAQQNGCIPVVFDSYESLHDIIEDGKNGYIVPAFNMGEYISKIKMLMDNTQLCETIAETCRQRSNKFEIGNIVDQWEALYKTLLS